MSIKYFGILFTGWVTLQLQPISGQTKSYDKMVNELAGIYSKLLDFNYDYEDSLDYYSNLFSDKLINFVRQNPGSLTCNFNALTNNKPCTVLTSADGLLRIYSWDTWQGGTMHEYKNIFQYKSGKKVFATVPDKEGDLGTYFLNVYTLSTNGKNYYLAVNTGSFSTKDRYESIHVYSLAGDKLVTDAPLIKTSSGFKGSISFEYDYFSVEEWPSGDQQLIRYDADKKMIYIPVVYDYGKVTRKTIDYKFNGQYFERVKK